MPTILEAFEIAARHHREGQFQSAEAIYRQILTIQPNHADAFNLLGVLTSQMGEHDLAVQYIGQAISLYGTEARFHCNLGTVFMSQRKLEEASGCFRRALELNSTYAVAHFNLGTVFQDQGKWEEAVNCFHRALELNPHDAEAHSRLGTAFKNQGKLNEAVVSYVRAIELRPDHAETHSNLGAAFQELGKLADAVSSYHRALELKSDSAEANNNLGTAFQALGKLTDAVNSYRRALELKADFAEAHSNLGNVFRDMGKLNEALAGYRRAMELKPEFINAHSNLLYTLYFSPEYGAAAIYEEHCDWNRRHAEPMAGFIQPHTNDANPNRRLRVGYVSPNFRNHAEAFFLAPLFSQHDHEQFEIFCYSDVVVEDDVTTKLRSYSDAWRITKGLSDEDLAQLVRDDQIDILVDLTMHMADGRPLLFARKPAPVQVCWLAYQGTTGLATMDYRLTDSQLDPPGLVDCDNSEKYYSEESVRLPDSFWCYDPLTTEPAVTSLPAVEKGYITFGSLNNFCKVNDDVLRLWARVLRAVDRSKLILLTGEGSHRQRTLEFLEQEGIAAKRITFQRSLPRLDYLRLYQQIDMVLDTFPYNGQTTTLDAVWMGVPVVTIIGQTSAARAGASLLRNLGTPELVADSTDQFVSIAVELANDWQRLSELRASLRRRLEKSPLMDAPRFAANVEAAYRKMWQRWCVARRDAIST